MVTSNTGATKFPVERLEFDRHNPRLVEREDDLHGATDESIMCALVDEADIGELVSSIVANTYLDIEPIIVTKSGVIKENNYRVLEGNRRLAAIRFILNPELARKCRLSMPNEISSNVLDTLKDISVYEVADEHEARAFIGFKHINGTHRWDAYAKARFIVDWYQEEFENGITIDDIAYKLGDNNQQVRSLISGMLVLKQAEDSELFDISDRSKSGPFGFSHLYTALNRIEYRDFLGLEKNWNQHPDPLPVSRSHHEKLREMLGYIYGSKKNGIESVIKSQNPDLRNLGQVLANPVALNVLRSSNDLKAAEEEVLPPNAVFEDSLIIAHQRVKEVLQKLAKFSPITSPDLIRYASEMSENVEIILHTMTRKIDKNEERNLQ